MTSFTALALRLRSAGLSARESADFMVEAKRVIEAQVRAQVAAEIEAARDKDGDRLPQTARLAMNGAARIARGDA